MTRYLYTVVVTFKHILDLNSRNLKSTRKLQKLVMFPFIMMSYFTVDVLIVYSALLQLQGSVAGGLLGLLMTGWLAVGSSIGSGKEAPFLPTSVQNCTNLVWNNMSMSSADYPDDR